MSRLICFIDKNGFAGTCSEEATGKDKIDCSKCPFRKKFKGREKKEFSYCRWIGELNNGNKGK